MLRLLIIPLALLGLVAGAVVWSNKGQGPAADFIFNARGDNKTLDLGVMSWQQDMRIAYCLWEGLYTCDPVTLKPIPGSAFAPEVNKEQTVYTFHIRPEARWSNGDDLTAGDFVFAWRRLLEQPGEYTYLVHYLKDALSDASSWRSRTGSNRSPRAKMFHRPISRRSGSRRWTPKRCG